MGAMKIPTLIIVLVLAGCASSTFESGRDFNATQVSSIVEGETTRSQIVDWFGEPHSQSVASGGLLSWTYMYSVSSAEAQSLIFKMNVETTSSSKVLVVQFRNNLVVNYTFTES
jgi:outer membrane protein assembly factor BamE (lipoprotein component of BamABCDE complex)